MEERKNSLWVESYRPTTLSDYVGNDQIKRAVEMYLESGDVPHLLLYGKAGTGKTTLAKIIINSIDCDYMIINASDENNVDTVRNKVRGFASSGGFKPFKIVVLDEFDYMTPNAQAILRNLMETFSNHCRFILTCNYVEKVIEPIQSRCQTFQVVPPTKKDVAVRVSNILKSEGVSFEPKSIVSVVDSSYPDIRKIINTCQLNSIGGELKLDSDTIIGNDYKVKVLEILKSKKSKTAMMKEVRTVIIDSRVTDFTDLFTLLYERVDEYAGDNFATVILSLSEGQFKHFHAIDKEIPTTATLFDIINQL